MKRDDMEPLDVGGLTRELVRLLKRNGADAKVLIASDEEGNSFSPVVLRGMSFDIERNTLTIFPLLPDMGVDRDEVPTQAEREEFDKRMAAHSWFVMETGGGCTAYYREFADKTQAWIADNDGNQRPWRMDQKVGLSYYDSKGEWVVDADKTFDSVPEALEFVDRTGGKPHG